MPHQSVLTSVLATCPSKVPRTVLRTPHQANHDIHDADHQNIDGIDDSDDESDDDDEDDSEDDHEDHQNEVAGSPLRPRVPVNLASKESASRSALAAVTSAVDTFSPSYRSLDGSSASSPSRPDRRGKLPSVTKIRERLAQSVTTRSALFNVQAASKDPLSNGTVSDGFNPAIEGTGALRSRQELPTSATQDSRHSADEFEPQPIELDLLELSFKYDHLMTVNSRTPTNALPHSARNMSTLDPEKSKTNSKHPNTPMPGLALNATSGANSALARLASRKRAASLPPLTERPSRRPACITPVSLAGNTTNKLPSSSASAISTAIAPLEDPPLSETTPKTFLAIRTTTALNRGMVHSGCRAGRPCRDYKFGRPIPHNSRISVCDDTLTKGRHETPEEVEYILSQANCYWARKFTVIWNTWCEYKGGIEHERRSQVEWLLSPEFRDELRGAASDCCPKEVIMIDD
jgi:hypothetical protein